MSTDFGVVVFDSTQMAIQTETLFKSVNIKCRVLTTPGTISAGCGLSVWFDIDALAKVKTLLADKKIVYKAIYHGHRDGVIPSYSKLLDYVQAQ